VCMGAVNLILLVGVIDRFSPSHILAKGVQLQFFVSVNKWYSLRALVSLAPTHPRIHTMPMSLYIKFSLITLLP